MSRRLSFIICCAIAGLGCNRPIPVNEPAVLADEPSIPRPPEAFEPDAATDNAVLDVVLSDLRTYDENGLPLSLSRDVPRDIYFSPEPMDSVRQPAKPLDSDDVWSKMSESQRRWTQEGISHLEERSAAGDSFHEYRPTSEAIHLVEPPSSIDEIGRGTPYGAQFMI